MTKPTLLLVDDERSAREGLERLLRREYEVLCAASGEEALALLQTRSVDMLISDLRMPGMDGLELMEQAQSAIPGLLVIILTAYGDVELAVEAMQRGATDFMTKPLHLDKLELIIKRLLKSRTVEQENEALKAQLNAKYGMENIIGNSAPMQEVFETIRQVAQSNATVLIQGESGTGKELVAKAVHQLSGRSADPFVPVHCAALAENLLESELFGHEKGAFTGALERRQGRFEKAGGGSLFLDEISEISAGVQVKLLRALEERQIERVGGDEGVAIRARLIAATNRDLQEMVASGDFREDLFYRLYVVVITLPPLRARGDDILLLLQHYLEEFNQQNQKQIAGFTPEAYEQLSTYAWPGNIRELRNVVERMVVLAQGRYIEVADLPAQVRTSGGLLKSRELDGDVTIEEMEKEMILQALEKSKGNRTQAAERLGMSRRTLHRKLNRLGMTRRITDVLDENHAAE